MGLEDARSAQLRLRFWGVRGSYPTPGRTTVRVGGNSVCMEVQVGTLHLAFDAGTGLIALGHRWIREAAPATAHVFLSHYHHDHIEGLRFFQPVYDRRWTTVVYGPNLPRARVDRVLARSMAPPFFPVALDELPGRLKLRAIGHGDVVRLAGDVPVTVRACISRAHPKLGVALYRIETRHLAVVYATDIESCRQGFEDVKHFARGADVLVHDAQYTEEEYRDASRSRVGWGHSTIGMACSAAQAAGVRRLILYHHDPSHDDRTIRALEREARRLFPHSVAAREGMEVVVG
ncbi:MAG: MBL fold metallo-hydrolase [Candidatus Binatia bacterium]|nr:MAG: MBL fold metallo-hydrolase [Candidatus Binatia bacterium]